MSFSVSLSGHFQDESKQAEALAAVRECAERIDGITDRDAGDTFSGYFSGTNVSVSFPEVAAEPEASDAPAVARGHRAAARLT